MKEFLFVYGTLRKDADNEMHEILAQRASLRGPGTYQGKLFLVDSYPGVISSPIPTDQVMGEVYQLAEPSDELLSQLDEYEECGPQFPEPTLYVRKMQDVRLLSGETISAWIYIYNRSTEGLRLISSGSFFDV